jgi:hypothetical protein
VTIAPSILEKTAENEFEKALLYQNQQFILAKQKKEDSADYAKAKAEHTTAAYLQYLKNCQSPCAYSSAAEIAYKAVQKQLDDKHYARTQKLSTIAAHHQYLQNCKIPCAYEEKVKENIKIAEKLVLEIDIDARYYQKARKLGTAQRVVKFVWMAG